MAQYKSLYEQLIGELEAEGKIRELSEKKNMQILQELSEGMAELEAEERRKSIESYIESKNIIINNG